MCRSLVRKISRGAGRALAAEEPVPLLQRALLALCDRLHDAHHQEPPPPAAHAFSQSLASDSSVRLKHKAKVLSEYMVELTGYHALRDGSTAMFSYVAQEDL